MNNDITPSELAEAFIHGFKPVDDDLRHELAEKMEKVECPMSDWHQRGLLQILKEQPHVKVFYKDMRDDGLQLLLTFRDADFWHGGLDWIRYELYEGVLLFPVGYDHMTMTIAEALEE